LDLKGEAYFEVAKDEKPFIIHAGEASVRVTGTRFNVKAYSEKAEIKITVTDGTVSLFETEQPQKEAIIVAGQTGIYDKSQKIITKSDSANLNDLAWKTRIMDFHNTPLTEIAEILSNTYHMPVSIDTALRKCKVTVRFENQEADSVLNILKSTLDLTIIKKGKRIIITGKGC
jgi:ferric-dicitrate binding protein FerR (iron transport regulator)